MKNKILNALKPVYGKGSKMGLADEALERAAAFGATFITSEEQIASFVTAAEPMLKAEQSAADRVRTELSAKIRGLEGEKADLEAKLNGNNQSQAQQQQDQSQQSQGGENQQTETMPAWAQAIIDSNKALSDELATFKGEQSAKAALAAAENTFKSNDYVKKYADEATDAWERATEMYEATGKKWTAEELNERAMGYFNKAVGKKGVDTTQPFKSDGGSGTSSKDADKAFADEIRNALGMDKGE